MTLWLLTCRQSKVTAAANDINKLGNYITTVMYHTHVIFRFSKSKSMVHNEKEVLLRVEKICNISAQQEVPWRGRHNFRRFLPLRLDGTSHHV